MGSCVGVEYKRIERVLNKDKSNTNNKINTILKSEIYEILSNYMNVENLECYMNLQKNGLWQIKIIANTGNFYSLKTTF